MTRRGGGREAWRRRKSAALRIYRAILAHHSRVCALDEAGRSLQEEYRGLYSMYLFDADPPGEFERLEQRHEVYAAMARRAQCYCMSLDARHDYPSD